MKQTCQIFVDHSTNVVSSLLLLTFFAPLLPPPSPLRIERRKSREIPRGSLKSMPRETTTEGRDSFEVIVTRTKLPKALSPSLTVMGRLRSREKKGGGEERRRVEHIRTESGGGGGETRERNNYYLRPIGAVRLTILPATGTSGPRLGRDCSWEERGEGGRLKASPPPLLNEILPAADVSRILLARFLSPLPLFSPSSTRHRGRFFPSLAGGGGEGVRGGRNRSSRQL